MDVHLLKRSKAFKLPDFAMIFPKEITGKELSSWRHAVALQAGWLLSLADKIGCSNLKSELPFSSCEAQDCL